MAAKTRKSAAHAKTATAIGKKQAAERRAVSAGRRQMVAVALFALALFLLFVVLIPGEHFWNTLHRAMFGLFGICAYAWPFVLGLVAVLAAADKLYGSWGGKTAEAAGLLLLTGAAVDIFGRNAAGRGFFRHISYCWSRGRAWGNGGAAGAVIGHPFVALFGHTGAAITVCLLLFVLLMFITGTTLAALFRAVAKPVKKIGKTAAGAYEAGPGEAEEQPAKAKFNVDIPLDGERRAEPELSEKGRTLVDAVTDGGEPGGAAVRHRENAPPPVPAEPAPEADARADLIARVNRAMDEKRAEAQTGGFTPPEEAQAPGGYRFPPLDLLTSVPPADTSALNAEMEQTAGRLIETLRSFGVESRIVDISRGPAVTRYELQPSAGIRISRVTQLSEEIAMNLATSGVRIAPIPNKSAIGIEVPNRTVSIVGIRELLESPAFRNAKAPLTVALGKDIAGNAVVADIAKMPHGLIAGATGSGKSVCINSIVVSLLYRASPDEVKLLLIDPKVVELGVYNGIPHLLVPVVTDPRKAAGALGWAVTEMEKRYRMFAEHDVRNLDGYNRLAEKREDLTPMPRIVIIVDELADLMMTAPKEVEDSINRIAAKARAAGMHLILATQRPSVNVVTGVIKANIPARIAFAVSSQVDSRTILDTGGAEKLMGRGDMLFCPADAAKPTRVQGCFVSDDEVEAVVEYVKGDRVTEYDAAVIDEIDRHAAGKDDADEADSGETDPMLWQAAECVVETGSASTSLLQRRLKLGYARAARIVDQMEQRGIVGPYEGSKPREVLLTRAQLDGIRSRSGE